MFGKERRIFEHCKKCSYFEDDRYCVVFPRSFQWKIIRALKSDSICQKGIKEGTLLRDLVELNEKR